MSMKSYRLEDLDGYFNLGSAITINGNTGSLLGFNNELLYYVVGQSEYSITWDEIREIAEFESVKAARQAELDTFLQGGWQQTEGNNLETLATPVLIEATGASWGTSSFFYGRIKEVDSTDVCTLCDAACWALLSKFKQGFVQGANGAARQGDMRYIKRARIRRIYRYLEPAAPTSPESGNEKPTSPEPYEAPKALPDALLEQSPDEQSQLSPGPILSIGVTVASSDDIRQQILFSGLEAFEVSNRDRKTLGIFGYATTPAQGRLELICDEKALALIETQVWGQVSQLEHFLYLEAPYTHFNQLQAAWLEEGLYIRALSVRAPWNKARAYSALGAKEHFVPGDQIRVHFHDALHLPAVDGIYGGAMNDILLIDNAPVLMPMLAYIEKHECERRTPSGCLVVDWETGSGHFILPMASFGKEGESGAFDLLIACDCSTSLMHLAACPRGLAPTANLLAAGAWTQLFQWKFMPDTYKEYLAYSLDLRSLPRLTGSSADLKLQQQERYEGKDYILDATEFTKAHLAFQQSQNTGERSLSDAQLDNLSELQRQSHLERYSYYKEIDKRFVQLHEPTGAVQIFECAGTGKIGDTCNVLLSILASSTGSRYEFAWADRLTACPRLAAIRDVNGTQLSITWSTAQNFVATVKPGSEQQVIYTCRLAPNAWQIEVSHAPGLHKQQYRIDTQGDRINGLQLATTHTLDDEQEDVQVINETLIYANDRIISHEIL